MTFGEKITKLRKEQNLTQEQLADILGVSRQSVSKWESNIAYPETDKLIRMGELFDCSMDYLLKEDIEEKTPPAKAEVVKEGFSLATLFRERKSEKLVFGMPLWHIGKHAHGFFALGMKASGVFALGFLSKGIVSFGILSLGLLSFGVLTLGLLAAGTFAVGLFAMGAVAVGLIAIGAVALGIFSLGACSIGQFAIGAYAHGNYFAMGDHAVAKIAVGDSKTVGQIFESSFLHAATDKTAITAMLTEYTPRILTWAKELALLFLGGI